MRRNVKDYGAKGDGTTDDTAAINAAIADGARCGDGTCQSSTLTPALVFFPSGFVFLDKLIFDDLCMIVPTGNTLFPHRLFLGTIHS